MRTGGFNRTVKAPKEKAGAKVQASPSLGMIQIEPKIQQGGFKTTAQRGFGASNPIFQAESSTLPVGGFCGSESGFSSRHRVCVFLLQGTHLLQSPQVQRAFGGGSGPKPRLSHGGSGAVVGPSTNKVCALRTPLARGAAFMSDFEVISMTM